MRQSRDKLQGCIQEHRQAVHQTLYDGNDSLHCCRDERRQCIRNACHQRGHQLNCRINEQGQILNQRVHDGHKRGHRRWDKLRKQGQQCFQHLREQFGDRLQQCGQQFTHSRQQGIQRRGQSRHDVLNNRGDVRHHGLEGIHHVVAQQLHVSVRIAEAYNEVRHGRFQRIDRAGNGGFRFLGSCARNVHALLHDMDGFHHIRIRGDVVLDTGYFLRIGKQSLHFLLRAAVAQLEVVEHRVVLLGKTLVGILNGGHIRAHLIGVVGHIRDCHIRILCGFLGIAAEGLDQACGKARHRFHVFVSGKTSRFVCVGGVPLDLLRGVLEQRVNAADQLLIVRIGSDDFFAELYGGGTCGDGNCTERHTYGFENLAEAFKLTAGFLRSLAALLDGFLVFIQLPVHVIEGGFGIVELNLPVLGATVILPERGGGILQSLAKGVDFCSLLIDLFSQHLIPCGESLHGFIVFIELRGGELHFGAEHLERLVDVRQCFLEFFFALKTDLQSETICHSPSPP